MDLILTAYPLDFCVFLDTPTRVLSFFDLSSDFIICDYGTSRFSVAFFRGVVNDIHEFVAFTENSAFVSTTSLSVPTSVVSFDYLRKIKLSLIHIKLNNLIFIYF